MSKPDRQLTLIESFRYFASGELTEREAEESIKALFKELVGEDVTPGIANIGLRKIQEGQNRLRKELRTKIDAL